MVSYCIITFRLLHNLTQLGTALCVHVPISRYIYMWAEVRACFLELTKGLSLEGCSKEPGNSNRIQNILAGISGLWDPVDYLLLHNDHQIKFQVVCEYLFSVMLLSDWTTAARNVQQCKLWYDHAWCALWWHTKWLIYWCETKWKCLIRSAVSWQNCAKLCEWHCLWVKYMLHWISLLSSVLCELFMNKKNCAELCVQLGWLRPSDLGTRLM